MTVADGATPVPSTETDEEGLQKHYDVILCGTGLIQSILAAALARQGYSCLHVDSDDVYGALEAVWTYDKLHEWQQRRWCREVPAPTVTSTRAAPDIAVDIPFLYDHQDSGMLAGLEFHTVYPSTTNTTAFTISSLVQTPLGNGRITAIDPSSVQVTLDNPPLTLPLQPCPQPPCENVGSEATESSTASIRDPSISNTLGILEFALPANVNNEAGEREPEPSLEDHLKSHHGIIPRLPQILQRTLWDLSFMSIFANGPAVHTLLESNVAEYLEFKSVEGLLWWDSAMDDLVPVPCAKNHVFTSRLVASPMEKRKLMKVLSLFMDYGTTTAIASAQEEQGSVDDPMNTSTQYNNDKNDGDKEVLVQSLNERHLNQGRSLARPQNKAVATIELDRLREFLGRHPNASFEDYLSKQHGLSPKLTQIIRFALALDTNTTATSKTSPLSSCGLAKDISNLTQHLQSLGRYGSTALLTPMYGSGELSQAFCRSAAVFGATYLLRRRPWGINVLGEEDKAKGSRRPSLAVVVEGEGEEAQQDDHDSTPPASLSRPLSYKSIACSHVVAPRTIVASPASPRNASTRQKRIVRRMSLLLKPLVSNVGHENNNHPDQRHLMIFPPKTLMGQEHVIYGMTADESIQVAPKGFTILYLTTVIPPSGDGDAQKDELTINATTKLLEDAATLVLSSSLSSGNTEIYHTTFSYVALDDEEHLDDDQTRSVPRADAYPSNVHLCPSLGATVTADVAFVHAQKLFDQICDKDGTDPRSRVFMGLSPTLERVMEERGRSHEPEDDEQAMLSSALGMLGHGNNADADPDAPTITSTSTSTSMTETELPTIVGSAVTAVESPNQDQ